MTSNRTAVQKAMVSKVSALMLDFMEGIFPEEDPRTLKKLENYLLGSNFAEDVFADCLDVADYNFKASGYHEHIGYGETTTSWENPPETEEAYFQAPTEYRVKMEVLIDSSCVANKLFPKMYSSIDAKSRGFAKLISDAFIYSFKSNASDLLGDMDILSDDLEKDWQDEASLKVSGDWQRLYLSKFNKGTLMSSGNDIKVMLDFTVDVTMENINFEAEERDWDY